MIWQEVKYLLTTTTVCLKFLIQVDGRNEHDLGVRDRDLHKNNNLDVWKWSVIWDVDDKYKFQTGMKRFV